VNFQAGMQLSEPARGFSVLALTRGLTPGENFQAGMQQPGILQPAEADSPSIGRRRFTEQPGILQPAEPDSLSIGHSRFT
jgi:hypothetical protein